MSSEVNCMNGGKSEIHHQQQEPLVDGMENNAVRTTSPAVVKSIVTEETDFFSETAGTNNHPVGTTCSASGSGNRNQKSKKRQNQKTFSLMDIFDMHQGIGSWADAAVADAHTTTYSPSTAQDPSETKQVCDAVQRVTASQEGDCNQYHSVGGITRPSSIDLDRATHSRNVDLDHLPDRPPFEVKVTNINYKCSDNDLFHFFGGEGNVVNIRPEGQATRRGIAIVSLSSLEALVNALKLNSMELQGRSLRISLREHRPSDQYRPSFCNGRMSAHDHQRRPSFSSSNVGPNNAFGHYKNTSNCHEGGYSTLFHPNRGPPSVPYRAYNSISRSNRSSFQNCSSYRGRDNRRYDLDSRQFRHSRPENNQNSRFTTRGSDSCGVSSRSSALNENHSLHHTLEIELDADKKGSERIRTESIRSSTTDGTEKHERRRLQLQPRTKPLNSTEDDLPARPTNIFGLAKPVDTYEKEKQVEERLRLENEAFKAADQRSRKVSENSERSVSVSASPLLIHGQISLLTKPPLNDHTNVVLPAQKTVAETSCKSAGSDKKVPTASLLVDQLVSNEESLVKQTETLAPTLVSAPQFPYPLPEPLISTVRRQSFSNCPETSETRTSTALLRTRSSYRTFTRSRDSVHAQLPPNSKLNIPVRRGKSGSRRGSANSKSLGSKKGKHSVANRGKVSVEQNSDGSNTEPVIANGPKQTEELEPEQQSILKEEKREFVTTPGTNVAATKQSWQQPSVQQFSKREKKKQTAVAREMPKYVEPKPFTFSSENKYAALLEADD